MERTSAVPSEINNWTTDRYDDMVAIMTIKDAFEAEQRKKALRRNKK